ncbi:LysR family transcriptional regulator [Ammoniphilus resinae]|uniref:DNA-binding transcriptional LysR family regulator n=1 Tax=Ammoniphilus resinae TaxID=861532 RepID=A0ABS4GT10_9BACL|nr:LysR family transcriptional regulator [Ammoniphilus resinae]MBP1933381.1 DNA-binding transcriptional LysR family regulator [Ammoniphilus resinae]
MIVDSLKIFITVIQKHGFSKAAETLHLSQPAVSLQIQNLEQELGMKLIHRSAKQVEPTQAGQILYDRAIEILDLYEDAKQRIHLLQNKVTGSLKIGASYTIGEYILPGILAQFSFQYPQVDIDVMINNTEDVVHCVKSSEFDLGLVEGEVNSKDLAIEPFQKDEMVFISAPTHPLAFQTVVQMKDLHDLVWIFRENGSGTRAYNDRVIEQNQIRVKKSYVFSSSQGVKEAVAAGLGIGFLSKAVVERELEAGTLVRLKVREVPFLRDFSIILRKDPYLTKATQIFIQNITGKPIEMSKLKQEK